MHKKYSYFMTILKFTNFVSIKQSLYKKRPSFLFEKALLIICICFWNENIVNKWVLRHWQLIFLYLVPSFLCLVFFFVSLTKNRVVKHIIHGSAVKFEKKISSFDIMSHNIHFWLFGLCSVKHIGTDVCIPASSTLILQTNRQ